MRLVGAQVRRAAHRARVPPHHGQAATALQPFGQSLPRDFTFGQAGLLRLRVQRVRQLLAKPDGQGFIHAASVIQKCQKCNVSPPPPPFLATRRDESCRQQVWAERNFCDLVTME